MRVSQGLGLLNSEFSPDVISRIDDIIQKYKGRQGCLIPVLTECQGITGYLPVALQEYLGMGLNIPASNIYGVVTFYSYFTMAPRGRHIIKVCTGTACYVKGIREILNRIQTGFQLTVGGITEDRRFSLEAVRCLGACGLAPVVMVNEDTHGGVTPDSILGILKQYE
jgi:NADH:ubiquinone oxidoreductase subunit E